MSMPISPADTFRNGVQLLLDKNVPAWVELWAEDGRMEFPFAPTGWPTHLAGKEAIAAYMRNYSDHIDLQDIPDLVVHETSDPATIVVEMRATGRIVTSDSPYDMTYIAVVTVHNGCFSSYRDYWNPLAVSTAGTDFRTN
ncbi:MAG: hypothetical protein AVDCRST_MAG83-1774 [uncultured Arthrobacter sp.]|uniref:SnoaL-like domain-containing protein n=1 Tax=uncultured Arthrobacter sp. TaxID=114050 RepID=A0A6J4HN91_9MICC|nr:nuclear transport factor 2 family protein [uncultured Arthrobacter sp.]CAA9229023.1 MAG: hypothetical protein AVDCRST_MAG83-1774 [uncultured Arthrobacter sp.]